MSIRNDWGAEVSAQEVFDHAVAHMQAQRCRCMKGGDCAYRGDDPGSACALGALLTDAEAAKIATSGSNGATAYGLSAAGLLPARLEPHFALCARLQRIHDGFDVRPLSATALESLKGIAEDHELTFTPGGATP
jgi:hypothetical protein